MSRRLVSPFGVEGSAWESEPGYLGTTWSSGPCLAVVVIAPVMCCNLCLATAVGRRWCHKRLASAIQVLCTR